MDSQAARSTAVLKNFAVCDACKNVLTTKGTVELFLKSLSVWINKPHVVNRRLCGSKIIRICRVHSIEEAQEASASQGMKWRVMTDDGRQYNSENQLDFTFSDLSKEATPFTVLIRELIPKSEFFPKLLEAIIYDKDNVRVYFLPLDQDCGGDVEQLRPTSELQYMVSFRQLDRNFPEWAQMNEIELAWSCDHHESEEPRRQMTSQWLRSVLLEKLVSWSHVNDISTSATSLQLVEVDEYKDTYVRLKNTYGRDLVKNWTERTDPKKFVYEDVAIAAYLLLIWKEDRKVKGLTHKQSFVDLGCGNGLLVYILTKEGHKGVGFDLRKRNIWDSFGPGIDLREQSIHPSADHLFPDYDWIIGNHSDELTPWIPVIAARSSHRCCFFVLPCCHHDFVGKFSLTEKGKSRYASYLDYVKQIVVKCGFHPESDTLRIPSTKRICFIGRERSYDKQFEDMAETQRQKFLEERIAHCHSLAGQNRKTSVLSAQGPGKQLDLLSPTSSTASSWTANGQISQSDHVLLRSSWSAFPSDQTNVKTTTNSPRAQDSETVNEESLVSNISPSNLPLSNIESDCTETDSQNLQSVFYYDNDRQKRSLDYDSGLGSLESDDLDIVLSCKRMRRDGQQMVQSQSSGQYDEFGSQVDGQLQEMTHMNESNWTKSEGPSDLSTQEYLAPQKSATPWAAEFQPRSADQPIRNCQTVAAETKERIVNVVFQVVLQAPDSCCVQLDQGRTWRKGGSVALSYAAAQFDKATLQQLKAECGGLQTLLRNHSHIFQVTGGCIRLRDFTTTDPWAGKKIRKDKGKGARQGYDTKKTTLCWFDGHHPDGCPRAAAECLFAHGVEELREKMSRQEIG